MLFLKEKNIDWKDYISKNYFPMKLIFDQENNRVIIYEKKFQQTSGSADEKPQTCGFKIRQYKKLFSSLEIEDVSYIYIFNDWFAKPEYKDMLEYIKSVEGCDYFIVE